MINKFFTLNLTSIKMKKLFCILLLIFLIPNLAERIKKVIQTLY